VSKHKESSRDRHAQGTAAVSQDTGSSEPHDSGDRRDRPRTSCLRKQQHQQFRAQASSGETTLTFTVLAGIVVGTSILGGDGAIWRTVVGVPFIALIGNGSDLLDLNALHDQIAWA
jgi:hypothetical protein